MKFNKKNYLPILFAIAVYLLSYQIPKILIPFDKLHYLKLAIDDNIKLFSPAILVYFFAFFQWINAIFVICKQETNKSYKYLSAIIIGSLIGFVIFMVYPTAIVRPEVTGTGFFDNWIKLTFEIDNIICAMPSFHCFVSTIVLFIIADACDDKKYLYFNIFISILVYISTLLTKQHYIIDVPTGILLAFVSAYLSKFVSFKSLFEKLNNIFNVK